MLMKCGSINTDLFSFIHCEKYFFNGGLKRKIRNGERMRMAGPIVDIILLS